MDISWLVRRFMNQYFLIIRMMICGAISICADTFNYEEMLERTPYAQLLKELICITDSIGLLKHKMDNDERRFVEDSILGKIVRATHVLSFIDTKHISSEDINYLYYWVDLAIHEEDLAPVLLCEICILKRRLHDIFSYIDQ